jgi:hypothetical protein
MPESVKDRPTRAHEYLFLLTKSQRYYYDADANREPAQERPFAGKEAKTKQSHGTAWHNNAYAPGASGYGHHLNGRSQRSVWTITTQPYLEAHFATMPPEMARRCIIAGTPEMGVCPKCLAPYQRITEKCGIAYQDSGNRSRADVEGAILSPTSVFRTGRIEAVKTIGWKPSCKCIQETEPVPATVLDPFAGACTTLHVAKNYGRNAIGIDLKAEYLDMGKRRSAQEILELLAECEGPDIKTPIVSTNPIQHSFALEDE